MLSILRDNYTEPLNSHSGASVVNKKWSELLYHTNRYMQRGSLMENYAIRKLQEQIICQVFLDLCAFSALQYMPSSPNSVAMCNHSLPIRALLRLPRLDGSCREGI